MANVLSLAVKITGDASGLQKSLTPAERAFETLSRQVEKTTSVFDPLAEKSEAAARAQEQFNERFQALNQQLQDGLDPREFTRQFEALQQEVQDSAKSFETAGRIIEANRSPLERYDREVEELRGHLAAGRIEQETFDRAVARAGRSLTDAERAARGLDAAIESTADNTLRFNELSGVFAVLPGPLGNVAGRLSGLSSAAEGLNRVFAGGLTAGIGNVATSFANLVNPTTAALAGVAAFGAGAAGLARGLVDLEGRVENLGRLADQLGVSFEFVQVLEEAGVRADVSVQALSGSFARLQRTLADGGEESKKAAQALQVLGVSVQEFSALSEQQQIELIGQRIATIEDPAKRSAAAIELFGRAGVQLIPFFNEIGGAANDLERFSAALSEEDRQRFASLGGSFDALGVSLRALSQNAMLPFIEVVQSVTFTLADLIGTVAQVVDAVGDALSPILAQVGVLFRGFGSIVSTVGDAVIAVFRTLATVIAPIGEFILPAVVAQMAFLNRQIIAGAISGLARTFTAAASTAIAYATSAGTASAATLALGAAVRTLLASTGIGALVVGFGLAANALISWFTAADDAADANSKVADSGAQAADEQARLAEELAKEETAMADAAARAIDNVRGKLSAAVDESLKFGQAGFDAAVQYQTAINDLQEQFDQGILNETSFRREAEKADAAFKAQIDTIKAAVAETEAITRRVDGLLAKANELPQVQQDINAIESEIARVEAAVVAARASGQTEQADALVARLAQLDQLQAGLEQQADEAAQGFAQGFDAAFANVDSGINSLIDKASEFGNAGAVAASQLQEGIAAAQDQVRDGILTKTAFDNEVARQKELFEQRVAGLRDAERIGQQIADQQRAIEDRQFELAMEREAELRSVRSGPIEVGDIRTAAGAATFLNLASGAEDPAVVESRKQTRELQAMNRKLDELATQKAEILAGTG